MTKKSIIPDLSGIPDAILKYADEYWQYWWVLLILIIIFTGYILFGKYFQ